MCVVLKHQENSINVPTHIQHKLKTLLSSSKNEIAKMFNKKDDVLLFWCPWPSFLHAQMQLQL